MTPLALSPVVSQTSTSNLPTSPALSRPQLQTHLDTASVLASRNEQPPASPSVRSPTRHPTEDLPGYFEGNSTAAAYYAAAAAYIAAAERAARTAGGQGPNASRGMDRRRGGPGRDGSGDTTSREDVVTAEPESLHGNLGPSRRAAAEKQAHAAPSLSPGLSQPQTQTHDAVNALKIDTLALLRSSSSQPGPDLGEGPSRRPSDVLPSLPADPDRYRERETSSQSEAVGTGRRAYGPFGPNGLARISAAALAARSGPFGAAGYASDPAPLLGLDPEFEDLLAAAVAAERDAGTGVRTDRESERGVGDGGRVEVDVGAEAETEAEAAVRARAQQPDDLPEWKRAVLEALARAEDRREDVEDGEGDWKRDVLEAIERAEPRGEAPERRASGSREPQSRKE